MREKGKKSFSSVRKTLDLQLENNKFLCEINVCGGTSVFHES